MITLIKYPLLEKKKSVKRRRSLVKQIETGFFLLKKENKKSEKY